MSVSPRHANKGTCDDPVRPTYFNGYPSISVAKRWNTYVGVRHSHSMEEVRET